MSERPKSDGDHSWGPNQYPDKILLIDESLLFCKKSLFGIKCTYKDELKIYNRD